MIDFADVAVLHVAVGLHEILNGFLVRVLDLDGEDFDVHFVERDRVEDGQLSAFHVQTEVVNLQKSRDAVIGLG